ncbi:glycosyltransferase [Microbacterium gorillae]|uniref:glycosyltransferase n=1 Tax=Microbacterium gorillae TaxID=1231063 RepID=UPI00058C4EAF|nr:glycosyltransferase [Microbacterium gorillae]
MSSLLICSTPAHGHVTPLLAIARHLVARGDTVSFLTSSRYRDRVLETGARFLPLPDEADVDLDDAASVPGRAGLTGTAALRFDMRNLFLRPGAAQYRELVRLLAAERFDAVLTEPLFVGAALLVERPRNERPPVVALGIFPLGVKSRDTAPFGLGIPPRPGWTGRIRNAVLTAVAEKGVFGPVAREADALARREVGRGFGLFFLDWQSGADAIVQFSVPEFEYPRSDLSPRVTFVGPLPAPSGPARVPEWWGELDGSRRVVHVSQGTIANADPTQLMVPTIRALGDRPDLLVVVSTGGRPVADLLPDLPPNVRAASYLPYDRLLPLVDLMVTNGGFGGVQQALAHAVPLVVAGRTEDKVEVAARVGWSGVGIDLRTNTPSAAEVGGAVHRVLSAPRFRERAGEVAGAMASAPGLAGLDAVLAELAGASVRERSRPSA